MRRFLRTLAERIRRRAGSGARPGTRPLALPEFPPARPGLTVAVILDPYSKAALRYEWRQVEFGPDDWHEVLSADEPDLLFVESAWHGNDDRWNGHLFGWRAPSWELQQLISWCAERSIPTVFWNKEDPVDLETFLPTARLFDRVYTVDADSVDTYRKALHHDRVGVLPFAAQPRIHNPVRPPGPARADRRATANVAFAGSHYGDRFPERQRQMDTLLRAAAKFGLRIYSRPKTGGPEFPADLARYVAGSLPYPEMLAAYKAYRVFLNVNSVTDSPTMCSRRLFELSACSTAVLSGPGRALDTHFGDLIPVAGTSERAVELLRSLLRSKEIRDRDAHRAMREVLAHHTCGHRVDRILADLALAEPTSPPTVSVLAVTNRPDRLRHLLEQVGRQRRTRVQLVLVLHGFTEDSAYAKDLAHDLGVTDTLILEAPPSTTLGRCLRLAVDASDGDLLAKMDDDDSYGDFYLADSVAAFSYADAGIVGKRAHYVHLESLGATVLRYPDMEHRYVDTVVAGPTMVFTRDVASEIGFADIACGEDTRFQREALAAGVRIYAADRFSFVYHRRSGGAGHTSAVTDEQILASGRVEFFGPAESHALI